MATKTQFRLKGKSRDSYMELVLNFPLASIKSDEHLFEAQRVIDKLLVRGKLDDGEELLPCGRRGVGGEHLRPL